MLANLYIAAQKLFQSVLGGRSIWGVADQLLVSFTNFATMILVAKGLHSKEAFGTFTLVYSAMLFANIIQFALVTQPHNVLGTARKGEEYLLFTTACAYVQTLLAFSLGAIAVAVACVGKLDHLEIAPQLIALSACIVFWQLQEFLRRVMYTELRLGGAFGNDLISYGGQTILTALLFWRGSLTGASALWALAITSAAACVVGVFQIRKSLCGTIDAAAIKDAWHFGKWLLGSEILGWCSSLQMFLYIAAAILGTAASGTLRAAQILFGPARVFSFLLQSLLPIRFSRALAEEGDGSLIAQMRRAFGMVSLLLGPYCIVFALFPKLILTKVFDPEYATEPHVLSFYAAQAMTTYWLLVITAALSAKRMTRDIFFGSVIGTVVALALSYPLIQSMGMAGVIMSMMAATVSTAIYLIFRFRATTRPRVENRFAVVLPTQEPTCAS